MNAIVTVLIATACFFAGRNMAQDHARLASATESLAKETRENTLATKELSKLCERLP
jgi:hypothetical protein